MPNGTTKVLVLDDDEDTRFAISRILGKCGCDVVEADSVQASIAVLEQDTIDVVFSDMRIPGSDGGEELLKIVTEQHPGVAVILMSCAMDETMRSNLMNQGASDCLQKPFFKDACEQVLQNLSEPLRKSA